MTRFKIIIITKNNRKNVHSESNCKNDMLSEFSGYSHFPQHYKELQLLENGKIYKRSKGLQ